MSKSTIVIIALVACLVLLAAGAWMLFGRATGFDYAHADEYTAGEATLTDPVENLDINWVNGRVNIEYHQGSDVYVFETASGDVSEDLRLRWWLDGTTLRIQYAKPGMHLFVNIQKYLTVSLPQGTTLKNAAINASSADFAIPSLIAHTVVLTTTSGNIRAGITAKELSGTSTSGDMDIDQTDAAQKVVLTSTSGNINARFSSAKEIVANTTSGDATLTGTGSTESLILHSTSGNMYAEFQKAAKVDISSTSGSITAKPGMCDSLSINATSGNVTAFLPTQPGFTCQANTAGGHFDSAIPLEKTGNTYTCGNGSAQYRINTTSGNIRIEQL